MLETLYIEEDSLRVEKSCITLPTKINLLENLSVLNNIDGANRLFCSTSDNFDPNQYYIKL